MKKVVMSVVLAGSLFVLPSVSGAALGDQTLREGIRHGDVVELQNALRDTGHFDFNKSTGYFGSITRQAVRDFQRSNDLIVDGIAGPQTFNALGTSATSKAVVVSSNSSTIDFSQTLRQGSRGSNVRTLQTVLNDNGVNAGTVDGVFGPKTTTAVRDFQRSAGITIDGVAGPQTYSALNGNQSNTATTISNSNETSNTATTISNSNETSNTATTISNSNETSNTSNVNQLIQGAEDLLGSSYVWGGTTPAGFDSSGFIVYVFKENGINLSRTHREYYHEGASVSTAQKGDVVFFETYLNEPSHAGIYLGNNTFIHNSSTQGVIITSMDNSYWSPKYIGAKRYIN
ncbi:peptidoglycan-binding protein [Bacillaceae bacterium IKA-2]|nr:peptidoglycan-binding protein [Bacillaceae bacterium IKA-2]